MSTTNGAIAAAEQSNPRLAGLPLTATAFSERVSELAARIDRNLELADIELTKVEQGIARMREDQDG